jgi:hypothetical protein
MCGHANVTTVVISDQATWLIPQAYARLRSCITTGKTLAAMLQDTAVRRRTAKNSLPWDGRTTHGKEVEHGKASPPRTATKDTRQSLTITHGKEW